MTWSVVIIYGDPYNDKDVVSICDPHKDRGCIMFPIMTWGIVYVIPIMTGGVVIIDGESL